MMRTKRTVPKPMYMMRLLLETPDLVIPVIYSYPILEI